MKSSIKLILSLSILIPWISGCSNSQAVEPQSQVYETAKPAAGFSQQQLDSLLAPIALYPDSLLSHILIASTYPLEAVEAERWTRDNSRLQGEDAVNAVESKNWDPSVKALVAFPDVLKRMSENLDWTQQLGDAFLDDEGRVMDSIQNLRDKAYAAGSLQNTDHVKVVREEKMIIIEPAVERVVYVPVYDTRVVYGPWWWVDYPPVYWNRYSTQVYFSGSFYWGPRVYIGPSFHYSSCYWQNRRVVIVDHHHYNDYYTHRNTYYNGSRSWHHNPVHRRGVAYYNEPVRARYNSNREPSRNSWDARQQSRDRAGVVSLNQNRNRDTNRQNREPRNNNVVRNNTENVNNHSAHENKVFENRSDAVRARLGARQQESKQESTTQVQNNNDNNRRIIGNNEKTNQPNPNQRQENATPQREERSTSNRNNNDNSSRQIIRRNDESSNSRAQREPRMDNQRETRMESHRTESRNSGGNSNNSGRRIIR